MRIGEIINALEEWAPQVLQESYDNSGLIVVALDWETSGVLVALDCIETVVDEAIERKVQCIIAHHPIVFSGLKRFNGRTYVERVIMKAIKHNIAIYAIHTNLDNVLLGVNAKIMSLLGVSNHSVLSPMAETLYKFQVYVPTAARKEVAEAIFRAGGGKVSAYEECSFTTTGIGTFKPTQGTNPVVGEIGIREEVDEVKLEFIVPNFAKSSV